MNEMLQSINQSLTEQKKNFQNQKKYIFVYSIFFVNYYWSQFLLLKLYQIRSLDHLRQRMSTYQRKKNQNQIPASLEERQSSQLSKYMRKEDINFLYYITQESVEDSGFDSVVLKQFKFDQESQKCASQKNESQQDKSKPDEFKNKPCQKSFSFSKSIMTPDQQFDKLLEITSRCIDYYNRFSQQKNMEFNIIQKTFKDLSFNLGSAFQEIINQVQKKKIQISKYLQKKHKQIIEHKNIQDEKLKLTLDEIKSVHLCNLLAQKQSIMMNSRQNNNKSNSLNLNKFLNNQLPSTQISHQDKQKSLQLSIQLHNYATTLNKFYCLMEQIQTNSFKEIVQDCVNFINNLITEQIKSILYEKIPNKIQQKIQKGFMNSQNLPDSSMNIFERLLQSASKSLCSDSTDSLFKEINIKQMDQRIIDQQGCEHNNNCRALVDKTYNQQNIQKGKEFNRSNNEKNNMRKDVSRCQKNNLNQNINKNGKFRPKILDLNIKANNTPKKVQMINQNESQQLNKQHFSSKHLQMTKFVQQICKTQEKRQKNIQNYNNTFQRSQKKLTQFFSSQEKKHTTPSRISLKKEKVKSDKKLNNLKVSIENNNENSQIQKNEKQSARKSISRENRQNINRSGSKEKSRGIHHSGHKIVAHRIIQI